MKRFCLAAFYKRAALNRALAFMLVFVPLSAAFFTGCTGMGSRKAGLQSYEGTGRGYRGLIHVLIHIVPGFELEIGDIEILEHREDPFIGGAALEELLELVMETGSTDLDAVSGATESSAGFLTALEDALSKARFGPVNSR